jgi:hypothetical protein
VGAVRRVVAVGVVVAGAAVAGVLLLGRTVTASAPAPVAPLVVRLALEPAQAEFGDPVTAHVVVLLDRRDVRPSTLKLSDAIAPLTVLGAPRTTTATRGGLTIVSVEVPGACLTLPCVARSGDTKVALPRVVATVSTRDGRTLRAVKVWQPLRIRAGVTAADLAAARPPFRGTTRAPAPSYRIAPSALAGLLDALAVVLVLGGVALGVYEAVRLTRRRAAASGGELERAIRLARQSETRPAPDRRRALALLARLLGGREGQLAGAASELAWSRPNPEDAPLRELVGEIEREVAP